MSVWAWARALGGACILGTLVWQVGAGAFVEGVRLIDSSALAAAFAIGVLTTVCAAWRWRLVAAGLGVSLPLRQAVASYYRAQFLNTTLPSGVVGDVHRAFRHGVRAVVLERFGGLVVQVAIGVIVLSTLPSPVRSHMRPVAIGVVAAGLAIVLIARAKVSHVLSMRGTWAGIVLTSSIVLFGQLAMFLLAARTAGATAPLMVLVPLTLFALLAMVLPLNIAGWGLREGAAAWAFGAAGLTATQGVSVAVTYGVLAFVVSLPGAAVLLIPALRRGEAHG